jgi:glutamate racemase
MALRPVGLFDSGVGGLSVLRHLQAIAPHERYLYFADTLWFPYGGRPAAEIRKRAFAITHRLVGEGAKLIVVACNTASAAALQDLRDAFPVPFVGMVPGVKPAAESSRSGRVIILATPGTLGGELYQRVVDQFGRGVTVAEIPGHGLAEAVEAAAIDTAAFRSRLHDLLDAPVAAGADTLVLGCTHYSFLAPILAQEFPAVRLVDTSEAVARRAAAVLDEDGLAAPADQQGGLSLIVSGDADAFRLRAAALGFVPGPEVAV